MIAMIIELDDRVEHPAKWARLQKTLHFLYNMARSFSKKHSNSSLLDLFDAVGASAARSENLNI
jgi:hypothetical protein